MEFPPLASTRRIVASGTTTLAGATTSTQGPFIRLPGEVPSIHAFVTDNVAGAQWAESATIPAIVDIVALRFNRNAVANSFNLLILNGNIAAVNRTVNWVVEATTQ